MPPAPTLTSCPAPRLTSTAFFPDAFWRFSPSTVTTPALPTPVECAPRNILMKSCPKRCPLSWSLVIVSAPVGADAGLPMCMACPDVNGWIASVPAPLMLGPAPPVLSVSTSALSANVPALPVSISAPCSTCSFFVVTSTRPALSVSILSAAFWSNITLPCSAFRLALIVAFPGADAAVLSVAFAPCPKVMSCPASTLKFVAAVAPSMLSFVLSLSLKSCPVTKSTFEACPLTFTSPRTMMSCAALILIVDVRLPASK